MAEQQEGEWTISVPSDGQVVQLGALAITASAGEEQPISQPPDLQQSHYMVVLL